MMGIDTFLAIGIGICGAGLLLIGLLDANMGGLASLILVAIGTMSLVIAVMTPTLIYGEVEE